jgi:predicted nuclease of restriction endonuclease-like RecB superfamily
MLTADHVDARRQGDQLVLRRLDARDRREAQELAEAFLEGARSHLGRAREEVYEAWQAIETNARKRRLAAGLRKLVEDACVFDEESALDPVAIRRAVFSRATASRRARDELRPFDRDAIVQEIAASLGQPPEELERALFADLRGEHVLRGAPVLTAASMVDAYELGRAQAILLRAVQVRCEVKAGSPAAVRAFFAWLKFQKLLFTTERSDRGGFAITIDGPFSMFESVTKYGLRLALVLPALRALEAWSLVADVRWGKERTPLTFHLSSADGPGNVAPAGEPAEHLPEDVRSLLAGIEALPKTRWTAQIAKALLDRPGLGVCIPDLELRRDDLREPVYVEVLGYWSRDAVWKRVELAQQGLGARIVFCASSRLRVSPEVIGEDVPAALYVYKGKPGARALLEHVDRIATAPVVSGDGPLLA